MSDLGLTVSQKKLVAPSTQVTCLGIMTDTVKGTMAIPPEKTGADQHCSASMAKQKSGVKASASVHIRITAIHAQVRQTSQGFLKQDVGTAKVISPYTTYTYHL